MTSHVSRSTLTFSHLSAISSYTTSLLVTWCQRTPGAQPMDFSMGVRKVQHIFHHESSTERQQFGGGRRTITYLYHGIWSGPVDSLASCSAELDSEIHRERYLFWAVSTRRVSDIQFHSLHDGKSYANPVTKTKLT